MELKKRLREASKSVTPFIESLNIASELNDLTSRVEELLTYGAAKEEQDKQRQKTGKSRGQRIAEQRAADERKRNQLQALADEENRLDQEEAAIERRIRSKYGAAQVAKMSEKELLDVENEVKKALEESGVIELRADLEASKSRVERGTTKDEDAKDLKKEKDKK